MPAGKPAGVRCVRLDSAHRCRIFGDPARPAVCSSLQPSREMCGESPDAAATQVHAMGVLAALEQATT